MPGWLIIVLAILYILSPLDLIPDVIPVVGWLDDIGALGLIVSTLTGSDKSDDDDESDEDSEDTSDEEAEEVVEV